MNKERTLSIIKPDAVERQSVGQILAMIEQTGLTIIAMKMIQLSKKQAELFYEMHRNKPFFHELIDFMTRCRVVVSVLEGQNAVSRYRNIMGSTNPDEAMEGTIRKIFGKDVGENAVHGSDSKESANHEINFFFQI